MQYITVEEEVGKQFFMKNQHRLNEPIVMLNLLRFKKIADYSDYPKLSSPKRISGEEAYLQYMKEVIPLLKDVGSELLFQGAAQNYLIGPQKESWDMVLLVKHAGIEAFMGFASMPEYLAIEGHRTAALQDSRLLPLWS